MNILHTRIGRRFARAVSLTALLLAATLAPAWAQTSTIDATSPATCITPQHACTTVPVNITRTDTSPILAFSVTFSLSSNLVLCSPSLIANITEGNYLHQASPTTSFQVRDRGNGSYTADGVILGQANCVSAGATGTLFNVNVTNNGGSGTGTVTLTSVTLRDCSNAPLGSTLGSAAAVTIDLAPVTVSPIPTPQNAIENTPFSLTPSATISSCATGPATWSLAGSLPSGATFNPSTGQIQWTPPCGSVGDYGPFTLTATAASGESGASDPFSIHVAHLAGTVTVGAITTPQVAAEGALLTITPSADTTPCGGSSFTWTISPALPAGAVLNPGTGVLTWTPDCAAAEGGTAGTYGPFTLTATASTGEFGSSNAFSIHVNDTPIAVAQVTALAATPVPVTAVGPGTVGLTITLTAPGGATAIEIYRAPFGNYPEYDNAPNAGAAPSPPGYPPAGPWTLTPVTASGQVDNPPSRDDWYYVAFAKNACGDVSPVSAMTGGTLNYVLGDVTDGFALGTGNNVVNTADITALGSHYGLTGPALLPYNYLDVGPTTTNWVDGRPLTDQRLDFEDLIIFAIDYHPLPALKIAQHQTSSESPADALLLTAPARVTPGETPTAALTLNGTGSLCGLSTRLAWDPAIVEPTGCVAGDGMLAQGGLVLSPAPGTVDAVALGSPTMSGAITLANVTFRVLAAGDPKLRIESADGRDLANRKVTVNGTVQTTGSATPTHTQLAPVAPNPSRGRTTIAFSLAHPGQVDLAVYAVNGRRIATLVHGPLDAGDYARPWDGRDEAGHAVSAGVYYVRLATAHGSFTRSITCLR